MGEKAFLMDAVEQFVQSDRWLDAVSHFLETHYKRFLTDSEDAKPQGKVADYTLEQYDSFMAFKERVERLLEGVVSELGCSGEDLVAALEENVRHESALTTARRFCIQTLLTFEDYDAFYSRISAYAAEKQGTREDVGVVRRKQGQLTAVWAWTANGFDGSSTGNVEVSEWVLQEAIARSILEAKALGQLDEAEANLVTWAEALVEMCQQEQPATSIESSASVPAKEEGDPDAKEAKDEAKDDELLEDDASSKRMQELEQILIREVDLLVAQRIADANTQMKQQMLNLVAKEVDQDERNEALAASGNAAEDELAGLFAHVETIRERLKDVKARCFKFTAVTQPQMDTMCEKVHYQQDLVSQEREISAFIFTQIQESDEALIPLMLEWLLVESELLRTQNQIQDQLNGTRNDGYWTQEWDDGSQAFYYVNSVSKESVWEPPSAGFYDTNQEFQVPGEDTAAATTSSDTAWAAVDDRLEAQASYDSVDPDTQAWSEPSAQEAFDANAQSTSVEAEEEVPSLEQASSQLDAMFELTIGPDASEMVRNVHAWLLLVGSRLMLCVYQLEMESVLERISREHDQERKRLELVFQLEKARQKEDLRKRKEKKRREKLARKKKKVDDEDDRSSQPLPAPVTPRAATKVDAPSEAKAPLSILVPGHGRVDLTHLLSDAHAKRHRQLKGINPAHEHAMLNPETLRFLTEQMARKQPAALTARKEILLEEIADEK
ncbi:hypothetical protein BBJ28_00009246 [Nothophytophthora sp. Chile5]|nr:hypothetical protein BBJ28_00009246 [Nothophytophthora sp. Chile5]